MDKSTRYPPLLSNALTADRRFNRHAGPLARADEGIERVLKEKVLYLSAKQVPSATAVRMPGSTSVRKNLVTLHSQGIKTEHWDEETKSWHPTKNVVHEMFLEWSDRGTTEVPSDTDTSIPRTPSREPRMGPASDTETESPEQAGPPGSPRPRKPKNRKTPIPERIRYLDYFSVIQGIVWRQVQGLPIKKPVVWGGDVLALSDPIPMHILVPLGYTGVRPVTFEQVSDLKLKVNLLLHRTHWGKELQRIAKNPGGQNRPERAWAKKLRTRLHAFLAGHPDPNWEKGDLGLFWGSTERRKMKTRSNRLIELLRTVDGMYAQRFLAYPEERWSYQKFDQFVLLQLNCLLGDEFIDGELTEDPQILELETYFSRLKAVRGRVKMFTLHQDSATPLWTEDQRHRGLGYFGTLRDEAMNDRLSEVRKAYLSGILGQKRGMGKPCLLVTLQAKAKFLRTITVPEEPSTELEWGLLKWSVETSIQEMPDHYFTGLSTKAATAVSKSSCWEETQAEGGTLEAVRRYMTGELGHAVPIYDLDNGNRLGVKTRKDILASGGTMGEYIFNVCLHIILTTDPEVINTVMTVAAAEPSKARIVTKATAAIKIVLKVVAKICAWPLTKVASSSSGMGKAAHGWELFKSFFNEDMRPYVFQEKHRKAFLPRGDGPFKLNVELCHRYASSTDYRTATDALFHRGAMFIGRLWMTKCGIPRLLQGIVLKSIGPRWVHFYASGPLKSIGSFQSENDGKVVHRVRMVRGVLMGNDMTKILLHLLNIAVRRIANLKSTDQAAFEHRFRSGNSVFDILNKFVNTTFENGVEVKEEKPESPPDSPLFETS